MRNACALEAAAWKMLCSRVLGSQERADVNYPSGSAKYFDSLTAAQPGATKQVAFQRGERFA